MKIAYMCFVSNGFDDHFETLVCASLNVRDFQTSVVKEYWKVSTQFKDGVAPYFVALNLETLQAKPLGMYKLDKEGKLFPQMSRGQYSGKPEAPDELRERAEMLLKQ
jgi:hypothetical protein